MTTHPAHTPAAPGSGTVLRALDPAARRILDGYLAEVAARLAGPARARAAILAELSDGLTDATHAYLTDQTIRAETLPHQHAARAAAAAVTEFGTPAQVADAFAPELAAATARRVALTLVTTGPLLGCLWLSALATGGANALTLAPPWQWPIIQAGGWPARLGLAVTVTTVLAAWLTVAATGRLTRCFPSLPRLPAVTAAAAAIGTSLLDTSLLALLAAQLLPTPDPASGLLAAAAAAASGVRGTLAGRAARHCLTIRPGRADGLG